MRPWPLAACLAIALAGCGSDGSSGDAPNIAFEPLGTGFQAADLKALRGKVVLLDFWATWCGPCRVSMPFMEKFHVQYHDKGLEVIGISQEPRQIVTQFRTSNPYTYPMVLDPGGVANRTYNVEAIPTTIVVDRRGRIVFRATGFDGVGLLHAVEDALKG